MTTRPSPDDLRRWDDADRAARPARLARLRERMEAEGIDAYFGVRRENSRYLTGFVLGEGEEKVAGNSGQFLVSRDEVVVLADSRYRIQAYEQCPGARIEAVYHDLADRWTELIEGVSPRRGAGDGSAPTRVGAEAGYVSHATWTRLAATGAPVELVSLEGWVEELRATKEPAEVERIRAACGVADGALERVLEDVRPGAREDELALRLEWEMRTGGAEALAFDVACLAGPRAALPHGSPGANMLMSGEVLLFDFGAQVGGYRSDMTRTLFVGEPRSRDREVYELVRRAQSAALDALSRAATDGERPSGRAIDAAARLVIEDAGHGERFGHGLGHGIGLATHEAPSLSRLAADTPLPSPSVFSVEPGVYVEGETGVRIEDLVLFDAAAGRLELLTQFPREATIVGG